ncbi:hypothetical protein [Edaphobacillus lindanitolerans]|uniref:Sporulation integral membrane protein YlbJ n=1 Tax=Edaphobacillus lindanitolerans TaxID=550447 RepID=A0A1U7PL70_9BACI|nr:hypothetical protein [Edaphobacillus lindanitolerans]SIT67964.1 hypothetical protein SAMN05428946_0300 [Edaphobacillus lindanitolerans]
MPMLNTAMIWCMILLFLFRPALAREGAEFGIELFAGALLPYLLPYLILTQWLLRLPGREPKGRTGTYWKTYVLGAFGGFPVGAASVAHLVKDGRLSRSEGGFLTAVCHAPSSMLLVGFVGHELFGDAKEGWLLMGVIHSVNLVLLVAGTLYFRSRPAGRTPDPPVHKVRASPLTASLKESSQTIVLVATSVIFFSAVGTVAAELLSSITGMGSTGAGLAVYPVFEMTAGLRMAADALAGLPAHGAVTALILSMNGLSIHLQVAVIARGAGIGLRPYVAARLIHVVAVPLLFVLVA